ncbi:MAG TPA: HlyD family efflux transporter periplasmic adaptor subunit [Thermoanaerobaculia bacterium]|nr:HlyD family efflux transporter periplasmic adaptor subunit [Thermoanaerobaculia bacterium]
MRRLGAGVAVVGALGLLLLALPAWLRPSIRRAEIRTARVDRGPIEGVIEASGTVVPAFARALSSPIEARVERILKRPGARISRGEAILRLDTSATQLDLARLEDRLAQKRNEEEQARLSLSRSLTDLKSRIERQRLDVQILDYRAEQSRRLHREGLVSEAALKAAQVEAQKAGIELRQLTDSVADTERSSAAQLGGLALERQTLGKERDEARHQLDLATTRSDQGGVLTWVVPEEGATVRRGDVLARVADLASFRIEATVSDIHAARLSAGVPVWVKIDERSLPGRVASIEPAIENGTVKFTVDLAQPADPKLRDHLRVAVFVVTAERTGVLRLAKGPYAKDGAADQVFVVSGNRAVRRPVRLGAEGEDRFEVLAGLEKGDEVIVSDMKDYLDLTQIAIR